MEYKYKLFFLQFITFLDKLLLQKIMHIPISSITKEQVGIIISFTKSKNMDNKPKQRKKKHIAKPEYKNMNAFKAAEKHYKLYQGHQTDFSPLYSPSQEDFMEVNGYQVCELPFPEGAYVVKNFSPAKTVL